MFSSILTSNAVPPTHRIHARARLARARAVKLGRLAREPQYWGPLRNGVAASVEHEAVPFDRSARTVLDVGASRGQFALFAAHRFGDARIICFEPLPESRESLTSALGKRIEIRPHAIGASAKTAHLNVSAQDDSSSLLPIGERQTREFPGTQRARTIEVPVETLEKELTPDLAGPVLLKIDVQGLELDVLRGAGDALQRVNEIFVECSFVELYEGQALAGEVVAFLDARGFQLAGVYGLSYSADGSAVQADFFFRRREPAT